MVQEEFLRKLIRFYPWFIVVLVITVIFIYSAYQFFIPVYLPAPGKEIYIAPKTSLREISNILEKETIIGSAFYFRIYLTLIGQARQIKPGLYRFEGTLDIPKVTELMTKGGRGVVVTIPEGLSLIEVQDILREKGLKANLQNYKLADFPQLELTKYFPATANLEGFLAPDTYEFFTEENEVEIATKLLKNFSKKYLAEFLRFAPVANSTEDRLKFFYEKLITASILEKEVKRLDDMRLVVGILEKRLKNNKRLEVDAPIAYLKCKAYPCDWNVSPGEIRINSPYNTYLNFGYPPTPINNPGLNALKAAFNSQASDFWYYLSNNNNETIFAKSFKEHQRNINQHLRRK